MRRLLFLACLLLTTAGSIVFADNPGWAAKASKAVFTLKTFAPDGSLLMSSNGFFISDDGVAVSTYAPFRGASRAVIIDAQGKEWPVECLLGANDIYDVAKFRCAARKTTALTVADASADSKVWLMPYAVKQPQCRLGSVSKTERFQDTYLYYTLALQADDSQTGCPVMSQAGEVIGLLQPASTASAATSYAVSVRFAADLRISGLTFNDEVLRATSIRRDLPDTLDEALLALYVSASTMDASAYNQLIDDFIRKYPNAPDGYVSRARSAVNVSNFSAADRDMQQALKLSERKDDVHYQLAQLIYLKELNEPDPPYADWTLDRALSESEAAYAINPLPVYQQQQAEILYAQKKYAEAGRLYEQLMEGSLRGADIYYAAALCRQQTGDEAGWLALLDSAVTTFSKPYVKAAAPYILARAQALYDAGQYRRAVSDYNDYERLMATGLGDGFYYLREQAEVEGRIYQQALNDINRAIELAPQNTMYYAEKVSLQLRVNLTDEAIETARTLVSLDPDLSDGYLFLGLAQCIKGQKAEGTANLQKAKELGNDPAQSLIEKYR